MIGYGDAGVDHDFYCWDKSSNIWNGAAFVAWNDANYASYRVAATPVGNSGRFVASAPQGTSSYELRIRGASLAESEIAFAVNLEEQNLLEADQILELVAGVFKLKTYERGTNNELIPEKTAFGQDEEQLTNPARQRLLGYTEE